MSIREILERWREQHQSFDPALKTRSERIDKFFADLVAFVIRNGSNYTALQKDASRPNWHTYENYLRFAATVGKAIRDMRPRDMIDIQSFLWVQGSDEYR
jgi:hypothetical protein